MVVRGSIKRQASLLADYVNPTLKRLLDGKKIRVADRPYSGSWSGKMSRATKVKQQKSGGKVAGFVLEIDVPFAKDCDTRYGICDDGTTVETLLKNYLGRKK